jgi:hypothetical protein
VGDAVTKVVPLDEAPHVLQERSNNPSRFTKIMVSLSKIVDLSKNNMHA